MDNWGLGCKEEEINDDEEYKYPSLDKEKGRVGLNERLKEILKKKGKDDGLWDKSDFGTYLRNFKPLHLFPATRSHEQRGLRGARNAATCR